MRYSPCRCMTILLFSILSIFVGDSSAQEVGSLARGVVRINVETIHGKHRTGTGFIAHLTRDTAYIITASHVIEDALEITAEFFTRRNRPLSAAIIGMEQAVPHGLAALLVNDDIPAGLKALEINRHFTVYAGDPIITIGFPAASSPWSVTRGEVAGRKAKTIIFSGAVDIGSSGGPLIKHGEVVGIISTTKGNFAYATPAVIAQYVLHGWGVPDTQKEARAHSLIAESLAIQRKLHKSDRQDDRYSWEDLMTPKSSEELRKLGILLAVEAMRHNSSTEAQTALQAALGQLTRPYTQIPSGVGFAVSSDWRFLANATSATARIWDITSGKEIKRFIHDADVTAVALSADGRYLATGTEIGTSRIWEIASSQEDNSMIQDGRVRSIAFSPDGKSLVTTGRSRVGSYFHVWDVASGQVRWTSPEALPWEGILVGPKGDYIAARNQNITYPGHVWVWEMATGVQVWQMEFERSVKGIAFSADGKRLAVSVRPRGQSLSGIWSIPDGREVASLTISIGGSLAFSPDDRYFATEENRGVLVWDLSSTTHHRLIPGNEASVILHKSDIDAIVFSPDGKYLAIESGRMASIREVTTGKEIVRMPDAGSLNSMAFSPDGQYLISDWDKVKVWQLWPKDLVTKACARLDRNLTPAEWRKYVGNEPYQRTCENLP